ncbi:MAG: hypothetical protein IAE84_00540, partial [Saprospiraceae bacterium]|nr:hypothetical protein [Saprospiraceae bacterium]
RSVEFAPGETRQCLSYLPPRVEEADSITLYTLRLQNAAGGHAVAIGEARQAELLIEAGIRCRVQQDSAAVNCALTDTTSIHNGVPLISSLKKDDSFWAGDFEVKVTESTGTGIFFGKGIIQVPYLQQAKVNVALHGVKVNEQCQMVAGEVKVEGVGLQLLSEELAGMLSDVLDYIETVDDLLQNAQQILTTIDQIIAQVEPYLPAGVVQNLVDAQQALHDAQAAYNAAVASGDPEAIAAAEAALQQALATLKAANQAYIQALARFFATFFEVVVRMAGGLLDDCLLGDAQRDYDAAQLAWSQRVVSLNQPVFEAFNPDIWAGSAPAAHPDSIGAFVAGVYDTEIQLIDSTVIIDTLYVSKADSFFVKEQDLMVCYFMGRLLEELTAPQQAEAFVQLFSQIQVDMFHLIGARIQQGGTVQEMVADLRTGFRRYFIQLMEGVYYPDISSH